MPFEPKALNTRDGRPAREEAAMRNSGALRFRGDRPNTTQSKMTPDAGALAAREEWRTGFCAACKWEHVSDTTNPSGNRMGVRLCPLHAAAPTLLAALEACLTAYEDYDNERGDWRGSLDESARAARAAIKKARGDD